MTLITAAKESDLRFYVLTHECSKHSAVGRFHGSGFVFLHCLQTGFADFQHEGKMYYWAAFLEGLQRVLLIIDDFTLAYRAQVVRNLSLSKPYNLTPLPFIQVTFLCTVK